MSARNQSGLKTYLVMPNLTTAPNSITSTHPLSKASLLGIKCTKALRPSSTPHHVGRPFKASGRSRALLVMRKKRDLILSLMGPSTPDETVYNRLLDTTKLYLELAGKSIKNNDQAYTVQKVLKHGQNVPIGM